MDKVIQIENTQQADYLESLAFEVEARRYLIETMLRQGSDIIGEGFQKYHDEYKDFFVQYEAAKKEFEKAYVLPVAQGKQVNWTLDYQTHELSISEVK